jgi:hypothetical protein
MSASGITFYQEDKNGYLDWDFPDQNNNNSNFDVDIPQPASKRGRKPAASKKSSSNIDFNRVDLQKKADDWFESQRKVAVDHSQAMVPVTTRKKRATHNDLPPDDKTEMERVKEHQLLCNQILAYSASERFSPVLKQFGLLGKVDRIHDMNNEELKNLVERFRATCSNCSFAGGSLVKGGVLGVASVFENSTALMTGYRANLEKNPELDMLCELVELDSGFRMRFTPTQRLLFCMAQSAATTFAMNRMRMTGAMHVQEKTNSLRDSLKAERAAAACPVAQPQAPQTPSDPYAYMPPPQ